MGVWGQVQRQGDVLHVVATRLEDHSALLGQLPARSRDFSCRRGNHCPASVLDHEVLEVLEFPRDALALQVVLELPARALHVRRLAVPGFRLELGNQVLDVDLDGLLTDVVGDGHFGFSPSSAASSASTSGSGGSSWSAVEIHSALREECRWSAGILSALASTADLRPIDQSLCSKSNADAVFIITSPGDDNPHFLDFVN